MTLEMEETHKINRLENVASNHDIIILLVLRFTSDQRILGNDMQIGQHLILWI